MVRSPSTQSNHVLILGSEVLPFLVKAKRASASLVQPKISSSFLSHRNSSIVKIPFRRIIQSLFLFDSLVNYTVQFRWL